MDVTRRKFLGLVGAAAAVSAGTACAQVARLAPPQSSPATPTTTTTTTPVATNPVELFDFVNPPSEEALQQCLRVLDVCDYPWARCVAELDAETGGKIKVTWEDTGQGNSGMYHSYSNHVKLNNRYTGQDHTFTFAHELGHMVDDTALRDDQRVALLAKWHHDLDGPWDGHMSNGEEIEWSHNEPHTHDALGWHVAMDDSPYNGYYHRPNEAFADAFVACFAPTLFPYKRFAHWSDDLAGVRAIILKEKA